uniref:Activating signal cointegrator 1 complex subunit 3 n=1 Tax=Daphnia galeata TaxID=27404 RepID=A0A8J2RS80_9CRUS|nr:unnamed protein product [Daphnia galeata]
MKPTPRLSRALRAFTNLGSPTCGKLADTSSCHLSELRIKHQEENNKITWISLVGKLEKSGKNTADIRTLLNPLRQVAQKVVGDECGSQVVEDCAIGLLLYFLEKEDVTSKNLSSLGFGIIDLSLGKEALKNVRNLVNKLPEVVMKYLKNENPEENVAEFGKDVKVYPIDEVSVSGVEVLIEWGSPVGNFDGLTKKDISFKWEEAKTNETRVFERKAHGRGWLEQQLALSNCNALSIPITDLVDSIMSVLCSSKSDDELQTEFFDLLGFDRFELIKELLENRKEMKKAEKSIATQVAMASSKPKPYPAGPIISGQVLVQSAQEKDLMKQVRREEKRFQKLRQGYENDVEEASSMKMFQEQQLVMASTLPIMKHSASRAIKYPNVYDSIAEAKQSSSFVGGKKMALPESAVRTNTSKYEEINIPLTEPAPTEVGNHLIPIASLDEISRKAFGNCKNLNKIQSVVFETAYRTNENMLICAPTGAGKTNIAMLTILHQIKQYITNGVLERKDQFKIVYVAPMKALAAEMAENFGKRLAPLGVLVRELTGDMQLTKSEIMATQMLITTPEKWDVITRKSTGDIALTQLVKLLIIDEVHLLHGDRGPVVEALVARTLRQVESSQMMIRILGLSATLPNYVDVAQFLHVNPYKGLFYFDSRFRPVPLSQTFIGVKEVNPMRQMQQMDFVCYDKVAAMVQQGHQVMVFVHARNATLKTAQTLRMIAQEKNQLHLFQPEDNSGFNTAMRSAGKSRNRHLVDLFKDGFAIHHAGMLRSDRNLVEKMFADGMARVLVCTATLAWGVNLPAHAVIIKGTEIYDAKHGAFVDIGILDVLQIFGRAGRPQFDKSGHGTIITSHDKLAHYLSLLTCQYPIESSFEKSMTDNLNAEITLGTVANVDEAVQWLSYTYLFIRMRKNPIAYGINLEQIYDDPHLGGKRRELIVLAARSLDKARMIRFEEKTGLLHATDLGRTASHFYIKYDTVEIFNEQMHPAMNDAEIFALISMATEFDQLKVRDDELDELDDYLHTYCELPVSGGSENIHGKVNILMQTYVSRGSVNSFSLISDQSFIAQNASRIARALFEIVLRKNWPLMSGRVLRVSNMIEQRVWDSQHPLRQFGTLGQDIILKLEEKKLSLERLREMDSKEIGFMIQNQRSGPIVKRNASEFPYLDVEATVQPITRTVLRIRLIIRPDFRWNDRIHGLSSEPFWMWVEDPENNTTYHYESISLSKRQVTRKEEQVIVFTIPIFEPLPSQYYIRIVSDRWLRCEFMHPISFQQLILPERHPPHTGLLDLKPLPVSALKNPEWQSLYSFPYFNPIQTQLFHVLYHTDHNVLLGAPTGSGKTIVAEIAMFRVFREYPRAKIVYIAPMKALVRERMDDWRERLGRRLGKNVVELTGDVTPDVRAISRADVIVTTPEKWDGVSRSWQTRDYVRAVALIIIDEIHLLGEDRGPVLEVIVSRTNFIASHTGRSLRLIGLSTAVANARDLADWLNIGQVGLFNFRPSVRPVPLEVHISGFPGKHYCPRMATMNKPTFQAIKQHSPDKPVLVFVSSRRQTRLTALDLIGYLAAEDSPRQFVRMPERDMEQLTISIRDPNLKLTLSFGVGIHHAGLTEKDRRLVEELFVNQKIQVLIATATLAWGVNFPAHLVVIKGTEYYDGKSRRYVDMPITDVLQMMGRAGRPQFDDHGVACVLVHDIKKDFYKKFLYEPFPVESSLLDVLPEHLNAEIVAGTICSKQDAIDYLTWTYFFRRLLQNPAYYGLEQLEPTDVNHYLTSLIHRSLSVLEAASCLEIDEEGGRVVPTSLGRIASYYYLSYHTLQLFRDRLGPETKLEDLLSLLSDAHEYNELPVRHNEDLLNAELAKKCLLPVNPYTYDSSHTKAHLLFQSHFSRLSLPCADYVTDTKSVLDQAIRILQAMMDVAAEGGWLATTLRVQQLLQMVVQAMWIDDPAILMLPHFDSFILPVLRSSQEQLTFLPVLQKAFAMDCAKMCNLLATDFSPDQIQEVRQVISNLPVIDIAMSVRFGTTSVPLSIIPNCGPQETVWIDVPADQECLLDVTFIRQSLFEVNPVAAGGARPKKIRKFAIYGWRHWE